MEQAPQRLQWGEQYELLNLQRDRVYGGGRRWTWQVQDKRLEELQAAMRQSASGHGLPYAKYPKHGVHPVQAGSMERTDDLTALVDALKRMPGYHGIRMQQQELYKLGRECWDRTHKHSYPGWPTDVPYVDKRQTVYHRPEPLSLDVLVAIRSPQITEGKIL